MEKSRRDEDKIRKRSRERVEMTGDMGERNREIAMQERKYFVCRGFRSIACHCRNRREIEENRRVKVGGPKNQPSSNKFKFLTCRMM